MSQKLPIGGFERALKEKISNGNWRNIKGGYFAEVDLGYGKHLHDLHNDYPLAPVRKKVNNVDKLIPNLHNRTKYVLHHEVLKFYEKRDDYSVFPFTLDTRHKIKNLRQHLIAKWFAKTRWKHSQNIAFVQASCRNYVVLFLLQSRLGFSKENSLPSLNIFSPFSWVVCSCALNLTWEDSCPLKRFFPVSLVSRSAGQGNLDSGNEIAKPWSWVRVVHGLLDTLVRNVI